MSTHELPGDEHDPEDLPVRLRKAVAFGVRAAALAGLVVTPAVIAGVPEALARVDIQATTPPPNPSTCCQIPQDPT